MVSPAMPPPATTTVIGGSDPFEVAPHLPVGDGCVGGCDLGAKMMGVVVDYCVAEESASRAARLEPIDAHRRNVDGTRSRPVAGVDVAGELRGRFDLVADAVEAAGDRCAVGEVRVRVGAREAVLDAEAGT